MKNLNKALIKFNRMYERISSQKNPNTETSKIVMNYGLNLMKLYNFNDAEINSKVKAMQIQARGI